jgi:hypothetical protein
MNASVSELGLVESFSLWPSFGARVPKKRTCVRRSEATSSPRTIRKGMQKKAIELNARSNARPHRRADG